ncbi:peptidase domain-containing protein [Methyloglobulus morosus KoM1]|uniref:Peptidase domain-containing protein n=1 Tax=Methyloglobulus morosus KoM1 TaxID=1116472 RepID=V5BTT7_9GAMM|nr:peptidase domain-containing protein [Methyloglobulus morosus KoM1]
MNLLKRLCCLIQGFGVCVLLLITWVEVASATTASAKPAKVVLLLHGMTSNQSTWNNLVNNQAGFDGRCKNPRILNFSTVKLPRNSEGIYCMRFNFGSLDRISTAPKGLDNSSCSRAGGCSGDYSTFDTLGEEIASVIDRIKSRLGPDTQVVLLGHSRGGVAARAFLQSDSPAKTNVVGLITTGTPHAGSPLGRYYAYMNKNCLPESNFNSIFDNSDCAQDWRFTNLIIKKIGDINLKIPTINFLSDSSTEITTLNANVDKLPAIKFTQIVYDKLNFGCLGGGFFDTETSCGFNMFTNAAGPSDAGLNTILNGRARSSFVGDGIVPVVSQRMSGLVGWNQPIRNFRYTKRIHTAEPKRVLDLSRALNNMYKRLGWIR